MLAPESVNPISDWFHLHVHGIHVYTQGEIEVNVLVLQAAVNCTVVNAKWQTNA